jgi:excisionase family DNA binding protein
MSDMAMSPILVTIPVAAGMLGHGITFVYEALGDGRLRAVKSGKRTLIPVAELHAYVANLPPAKIKPDNKERRRRMTQAEARAA